MSDEARQIGRRFIEAFAAGDTDALAEIVTEDVYDHNRRFGVPQGRQPLLDAVKAFKSALPDLEITIDQELAEGDLVANTGFMSGTHEGDFMGIPPTNNRVVFAWMDMHRVKDGKIVESWHVEDGAAMLAQMGAMSGSE
jgi:steroid delta-isomerase-like uncharacterized protein